MVCHVGYTADGSSDNFDLFPSLGLKGYSIMANLKLRNASNASTRQASAKGGGGKKSTAKAKGGKARGGTPYSGQSRGGGNSDLAAF